jgi:outer membrane lipoprotein-sorting protein
VRTFLVLTTVVFAPFSIRAQDAVDLLSKAAANVRTLSKSSYDFEEVQVRDSRGSISNRTEQRVRLAGSGGRYRSERLPAGPLYLFDGSYRWAYNPERNEYTKSAGVPAVAPDLSEFELAAFRVKSARVLRQESLELAAGPVVCQVVEAIADRGSATQEYSPITYWIELARTLILKMDYTITFKSPASSTRVTEYFTKASVGQSVDDGLFRFTPLDGAVEVDRLNFGPKSALAGKDCPDFELKTLDGKSITRATLLGQATLLQFGLGNDDVLFQAELTYRALRGSRLNVVYIPPMKFDAGAYTVPVAIDPAFVVAGKFGLHSGAVLIDRFGKIAYAGSSQQELMRALQLAGIW